MISGIENLGEEIGELMSGLREMERCLGDARNVLSSLHGQPKSDMVEGLLTGLYADVERCQQITEQLLHTERR